MRRGGVAVEVALSLPVVALMLVGILEWGWYLQREAQIIQSVREGALAASVTSEALDPLAAAEEHVNAALLAGGFADATVVVTEVNLDTGLALRVDCELPYPSLLGIVPTPARLGASTTMRLVDQ
mgnify:CR=1 FL=1